MDVILTLARTRPSARGAPDKRLMRPDFPYLASHTLRRASSAKQEGRRSERRKTSGDPKLNGFASPPARSESPSSPSRAKALLDLCVRKLIHERLKIFADGSKSSLRNENSSLASG